MLFECFSRIAPKNSDGIRRRPRLRPRESPAGLIPPAKWAIFPVAPRNDPHMISVYGAVDPYKSHMRSEKRMFRFLSGHHHPPMMHPWPHHHPCAMDPRFHEAYHHVKRAYKIMKHMKRSCHKPPHRHRHPHRPPYCGWESNRIWSSSSPHISSSRYSTSADD